LYENQMAQSRERNGKRSILRANLKGNLNLERGGNAKEPLGDGKGGSLPKQL